MDAGKKNIMPSKVKIISSKELENMHTGSLMSRRKALLACEESLYVSDRDENYQVKTGYIEFKQSIDTTTLTIGKIF